MITINLQTIGNYIWKILIVTFHLVRIGLVFVLGSMMALYAMMFWEEKGLIVMFIIVITMTDWMISLYLGDWMKR